MSGRRGCSSRLSKIPAGQGALGIPRGQALLQHPGPSATGLWSSALFSPDRRGPRLPQCHLCTNESRHSHVLGASILASRAEGAIGGCLEPGVAEQPLCCLGAEGKGGR